MKDLICNINENLLAVLQQIDRNGKRTIFAVDNNNRFLGVITDGDIRRHILAGKNLNVSLGEIAHEKESFFAPYGTDYSEIIKICPQSIKIIPLLNEQKNVVDYIELNKEFHAPIASTELSGNELAYVIECVTSNWISSQGRFVDLFEKKFAQYIGVECGIAVANGTVALHLALSALNIGPGDEVIVPDLTFAATINAVLYVGAIPVLVDVDNNNWCIDPALIELAITPRTKAIIPVHLYGFPCDIKRIMEIATRHGIFVIEDCAQAHGAEHMGQKVGSFGHINCFSFFANKIVTTGEGGMCLTNNLKLAQKMRILRDHGMDPDNRYWHNVVGYNFRMTNLQAAVGVAQTERIEHILNKRDEIAQLYSKGLNKGNFLKSQKYSESCKPVTWLVSYLISNEKINREDIINLAQKYGITIRPFFHALSTMPIYSSYASSPLFNSKYISKYGLSFPTITSMPKDDYALIIRKVNKILKSLL